MGISCRQQTIGLFYKFYNFILLGKIGFRVNLSHSNRTDNRACFIIVRVGLSHSLAISAGRSTVYKEV